MSADVVDEKKRRFLVASTSVMGAVGAGFVAVPFLSSWSPSERAKNAGAPVEVDISALEEGRLMIVEWQSKPVWIIKRSAKTLSDLETLNDSLRDPNSENAAQQGGYAQNIHRSRKPEIMGDAAHVILTNPSREFTGNFCVDDEVLESAGVTDLSGYAVDPSVELAPDFFVDPRR